MRIIPARAVCGVALWLVSQSPGNAATEQRPPNVVLILVDDLGWTDLGCFGSDLYETPNIDRLASEGMRFNAAYAACTVCSPTRAALLTGKAPARLHLTDWIHGHDRPDAPLLPPAWTEFLPSNEATLAEVLKPAGYTSTSIGKWHLGDEPEHWPDAQGFDANVAGFGKGQPPSYFAPYQIPTLIDGPDGEYLTDRLGLEAARFIAANAERPFFLYAPHYAVHTPLQAKAGDIERYRSKLTPGLRHDNPVYAAMVESMDAAVGRTLEAIDRAGVRDETLVIVTSDNGGLELRGITENAPLRDGKGSAFEGGVRVPLIVRWPGVVPPGSTCIEPVISHDLFPTILEAAGIAMNDGALDGRSIVPLLRDPDAVLGREALYWHYPHYHPGGATPHGAIRAGDWRLVQFFEGDRVELYNLADDPGESRDLAPSMPAKAAELRERLEVWRAAVGAQMPRPNPAAMPASPVG